MPESLSPSRPVLSRQRLDALTDGVFAVAMTLLVIELRLPEGFSPKDGTELLHRLAELGSQTFVYVVSFYVLGLRWIGMVQTSPASEQVSTEYTRWALLHLLLVTFLPFSTMVIGRYTGLAPAVWIYAGNIILFSLVALRMFSLNHEGHDVMRALEHRLGLIVLIAASVLAIAASLVVPRWAMLAYLVNLLDEPLRRLLLRRRRHAAD